MEHFKKVLMGYNRDAVDQHFFNRERESESQIKAKYYELDKVREDIQRNKENIKTVEQNIEVFEQRKEQVLNSFIDQLAAIEQSLKNNQDEVRRTNLAALELLQHKIDELEKWNSLLKECYNDILAVRNKYQISHL